MEKRQSVDSSLRNSFSSHEEHSREELEGLMNEKAQEIFQLCDHDMKGYITKSDMQRLQDELPLSPDQLDVVFDRLDEDGSGQITRDKFTKGFGSFLGLSGSHSYRLQSEVYENDADAGNEDDDDDDDGDEDDDARFDQLLKNLGASTMLDDVQIIKSIWSRLHRHQPEVVDNFEDLLRKITTEMNKKHIDYHALQIALRNKSIAHDEEVRKLYDEMEKLIDSEKEQIRLEEKHRERQLKDMMQNELQEKDERLQELLAKQQEMERKLTELNAQDALTKQENERLLQEKEAMEEMIACSHHHLEESKSKIFQLQMQQKEDRRDKVVAAAQISEWIAMERESLVKQLHVLKEMNRKLQDDNDEADGQHRQRSLRNTPRSNQTSQQRWPTRDTLPAALPFETDDVDDDMLRLNANNNNSNLSAYWWDDSDKSGNVSRLRQQPIGANNTTDSTSENAYQTQAPNRTVQSLDPQRVYKIVFVGDSGVGKTSFLHRICHKSFKSSFSSTIGVDFQVYKLSLDDQIVALQLWDTAGQERFRTFTKQYFRKADGVLVMYDVTSETSFRNVREWLSSIEQCVEEGTVTAIIGNKIDLLEDGRRASVSSKLATALAKENGALFFETSSKTGQNTSETLESVARLLRDREDRQLEQSVILSPTDKDETVMAPILKKISCCNT